MTNFMELADQLTVNYCAGNLARYGHGLRKLVSQVDLLSTRNEKASINHTRCNIVAGRDDAGRDVAKALYLRC